MSIYTELENLEVTQAVEDTLLEVLTDFFVLGDFLRNSQGPKDLLVLLKVELMNQSRPSFVSRIYGRYRKLLPSTDMPLIDKWGRDYGKRRKEN